MTKMTRLQIRQAGTITADEYGSEWMLEIPEKQLVICRFDSFCLT